MFNIHEIEPYGSVLVVGIDKDPNKIATKLNIQNQGINLDYPAEHVAAITFERMWKPAGSTGVKQYIFVIIDAAYAHPATIAHEAVHVVNFIFNHVGVHLDLNNDEAQAYLTGYIVHLIHQTTNMYLKKNNKKNGKK